MSARRRRRQGGLAAVGLLAIQAAAARAELATQPDTAEEAAEPIAPEILAMPATHRWELALSGYIDIGFADVQGDGTSFAPGDTRVPADYVADTFATPVNSRGDVASTGTDRFTNGFLPRSMGIGGRPSFLLNVVNQDLRYHSADDQWLVFVRAQLLPRFSPSGSETRLWVEQAFAKVVPFRGLELSLTVGKFDSVFGIEYLDNPSNLRVGVTPSLIARYTTGQEVGAKLFYRVHVPAIASSFSLNLSASNGGTEVESLQPVEASLTGRPVLAGRFGYELGTGSVQLRLGASGLYGPRNDQYDPGVHQKNRGVDARLFVAGVSLSGEWIYYEQERGTGAKVTGTGTDVVVSGFEVHGLYVQLAYRLPVAWGVLAALTPYARGEQRRGQFEGFPVIESRRLTTGARLDFANDVALKGEWLFNREAAGALPVKNDVLTLSLVTSW
jgi:hypothetical protein